MKKNDLKMPGNLTTRLSRDAYLNAEILRRHAGLPSVRAAVESQLEKAVLSLLGDPSFVSIVQEVRGAAH